MTSRTLLDNTTDTLTLHASTSTAIELIWRSAGEGRDLVSFARTGPTAVTLRVGTRHYVLRMLARTCVLAPNRPPEFSTTTIRAQCSGGTGTGIGVDTGTMLITVDCGREPPMLAVDARLGGTSAGAWVWQIDHHIQHQLLDLFADA